MMQTWRDSTSQDYEIKDREVHLQSSTIFSGCKTVRRTGYDSVCSNIQAKGCFFFVCFLTSWVLQVVIIKTIS